MSNPGYESISNDLVANDKLELQAEGEDVTEIIRALPLKGVQRVLDVGCGSGFLTRVLAELLGPEVEICGIDISSEHIRYARQMGASEGLRNVHYMIADILRPLDELAGRFDLIYEKYVMMSMVPKGLGQVFLRRMMECSRAGGKVICFEADINFGQDRYPPPPESLAKVLPRIVDYYREQGLIEWRCGIQLFHHMKQAGFSDLQVKIVDGRILAGGFPEQLVEHDSIDVEQLLTPCLESVNALELLEEAAQQWREYLNSPESFLCTPIFAGVGTVRQSMAG